MLTRRRAIVRLTQLSAALAWSARHGTSRAEAPGTLRALRMPDAPHAPGSAPDLMVHVQSQRDARRPLDVVVFLHGFSCCAQALVADAERPCADDGSRGQAYGLAQRHADARTNSVLIVPQLAYLARDARAPRFSRPGGFDAVLAAALGPVDGAPTLGRVLLVAHSAGYRAALDILRDRTRHTPVYGVLLLDALYAGWDVFAGFVSAQGGGGALVSLHTAEARTTAGNAALLARLGARGVRLLEAELAAHVQAGRGLVSAVRVPHGKLPERYFTPLVRALLA